MLGLRAAPCILGHGRSLIIGQPFTNRPSQDQLTGRSFPQVELPKWRPRIISGSSQFLVCEFVALGRSSCPFTGSDRPRFKNTAGYYSSHPKDEAIKRLRPIIPKRSIDCVKIVPMVEPARSAASWSSGIIPVPHNSESIFKGSNLFSFSKR